MNQYKKGVECLELFANFEITLQKCQMVVLSLYSNLESLLKGLDIHVFELQSRATPKFSALTLEINN